MWNLWPDFLPPNPDPWDAFGVIFLVAVTWLFIQQAIHAWG